MVSLCSTQLGKHRKNFTFSQEKKKVAGTGNKEKNFKTLRRNTDLVGYVAT
jgi:hypothetical protein